MQKVAVIVAPGFEEGETLTIIDILRRAGITCDSVGFDKEVIGGHDIAIQCDRVLDDSIQMYDMVVLPGGYPGATNLKNNDKVIKLLKDMSADGKWIAAICAAPIVLEQAGLLENKKFTAYPGYGTKINSGHYLENIVVVDGKLITSRGPATTYAFAYELIDILNGDSLAVKNRMVYFNSFEEKEKAYYV
ncbi:DJ-1 family glyoxalase III [Enterococcus sp. LJL99]